MRAATTYSIAVQCRKDTMREFIHKCEDRIHGVLSCFDRMLFRGYGRWDPRLDGAQAVGSGFDGVTGCSATNTMIGLCCDSRF